MDAGGPKGKAKSDINVTPLIDIVLVLLIVFIVMVPGLSKALPVVVPQVVKVDRPTPPDPKNPPLVVTIDQNGDLMLQNDKIQLSELADKLSPVVQLQPSGMRKVFLRVDEEQAYQYAVNVLDQIKVASDRAKRETALRPEFVGTGLDGGDVKVVAAVKKRTPTS